MIRTSLIFVAAISTVCGLAAAAAAQAPRPADSGWTVYFQYCAGCHDHAELSADKTVPVIRELGEPRTRRALTKTPTAIHGDLVMQIADDRLEKLIQYLSPDNDRSLDCGPPEMQMLIDAPQCPAGQAAASGRPQN